MGEGQCVSISRLAEIHTSLYQLPWQKKTGKLKKLLAVSYNGISLAVEGRFVFYYVNDKIVHHNKSNEDKIRCLFKWGELISYEAIVKMYKIIYMQDLPFSKEEIGLIFPCTKKKYFTGVQPLSTIAPTQDDVNQQVEFLKAHAVAYNHVKVDEEHNITVTSDITPKLKRERSVSQDMVADDLYDLDADELYHVPTKRKIKAEVAELVKFPRLVSQYSGRPVSFTFGLFDQLNKYIQ